MKKIFLLSPANSSGKRAAILTSEKSPSASAQQYRSAGGILLSDAYAFMSSLYFRGKLQYAKQFGDENYIIAPGYGLVTFDWKLTPARFAKISSTDVRADDPAYAKPLRASCEMLLDRLGPGSKVVLLGSIATGKYLDILKPVFGERLFFPTVFKGLGDMSRGGLMLKACRENLELEYSPTK